jgi:hypothetical protein
MMYSDIDEAWNSPLHKQINQMHKNHEKNKTKSNPPWQAGSHTIIPDMSYDEAGNFYSIQGEYLPMDAYKGDPKFRRQEQMDPNGYYKNKTEEGYFNPTTHRSGLYDRNRDGSGEDKPGNGSGYGNEFENCLTSNISNRSGTSIHDLRQKEGFCHNLNTAQFDAEDKKHVQDMKDNDSCLSGSINGPKVRDTLFYTDPDPKCSDDRCAPKKSVKTKEHFESDLNCDKVIRHLKKCSKCRSKLKMESSSYSWFTQEIKEILIFVLIGIFIIFILDIFVRLGRNFPRY